MPRAVAAPSNQWPERDPKRVGATALPAVLIDDPVHAGFVTFSDELASDAFLIDDVVHTGFVTPDDAALAADARALLVGGEMVIILGAS